jgi:hypothetical protein
MIRVKNISNFDVKIAAATASNASVGLILKPGEYCYSKLETKMINAQRKKSMIQIEEVSGIEDEKLGVILI